MNKVRFFGSVIAIAFGTVLVFPVFAAPALKSKYLSSDEDIVAIAEGRSAVRLPEFNFGQRMIESIVQWKIFNALRMIGYEVKGMPYGAVIDREKIIEIDNELYRMESVIASQAAKLPFYPEISGPDFKDNIPQDFAAYLIATIFDLFNAGSKKYQLYTRECLFSSFISSMCGSLVEGGTTDGNSCRDTYIKSSPHNIKPIEELRIQTEELFGFLGTQRAIGPDEYPEPYREYPIASTYGYAATLIHEFIHDMDVQVYNPSNLAERVLDRVQVCTGEFMDFRRGESPFYYKGGDYEGGEEEQRDKKDFVSHYAGGLPSQVYQSLRMYKSWEDVAETVTAYILTPEYFRYRMKDSRRLSEKYECVKNNIFSGVEFSNPNLPPMSEYEFPDVIGTEKVRKFVISDIKIIQPGMAVPQLTECPDAADLNRDGVVNVVDLVTIARKFGQSVPVGSGYPEDVNGDGQVNIIDLVTVARKFGQRCGAGAYVPSDDHVVFVPVPVVKRSQSTGLASVLRSIFWMIGE